MSLLSLAHRHSLTWVKTMPLVTQKLVHFLLPWNDISYSKSTAIIENVAHDFWHWYPIDYSCQFIQVQFFFFYSLFDPQLTMLTQYSNVGYYHVWFIIMWLLHNVFIRLSNRSVNAIMFFWFWVWPWEWIMLLCLLSHHRCNRNAWLMHHIELNVC